MKIKKKVPLIDQHDKNYMYGGKFGGNFIPETLKKPINELTKLFGKLRKEKKFINQRDYYFKNYVGAPTPFIKLENLTDHLGGAQIYAKVVSEANGGAHEIYNATVHCLIAKRAGKKFIVGDTGAGYAGKMLSMAAKKFGFLINVVIQTLFVLLNNLHVIEFVFFLKLWSFFFNFMKSDFDSFRLLPLWRRPGVHSEEE